MELSHTKGDLVASSNEDEDLVMIDMTLLPSTLLRGTSLDEHSFTLSLSKPTVYSLTYRSLCQVVVKYFTDLYKMDLHRRKHADVLHYLKSKKLQLMVFRKSRSKNSFAPMDSNFDFKYLKSALSVKQKFKFVLLFVKASTINRLGRLNVTNSIVASLKNQYQLRLPAKAETRSIDSFDNLNSSSLFHTQSHNRAMCSKTTVAVDNSDDTNTTNLPDSSSISLQLDPLFDFLKSYFDPLNSTLDKNISVMLDGINNLKSNISNNMDPIQKKVDEIYTSILELANDSPDSLPQAPATLLPRCNVTHSFVLCDGCDRPISGFRFKCIQCTDFDLCEDCDSKPFETSTHFKTHQMLRIFLDEKPLLTPLTHSQFPTPRSSHHPPPRSSSSSKPFESENFAISCFYSTENQDLDDGPFVKITNKSASPFAGVFYIYESFIKLCISSIFSEFDVQLKLPFETLNFHSDKPTIEISFVELSPVLIDHILEASLSVIVDSAIYIYFKDSDTRSDVKCSGEFVLIEGNLPFDNENKVDHHKNERSYPDTAIEGTDQSTSDDVIAAVEDAIVVDEPEENVKEEVNIIPNNESNTTDDFKNDSTVSSEDLSISAHVSHEDPEFELLAYYPLDFNSGELEVRLRSSFMLPSNELISLSVCDLDGNSFTSELVGHGDCIWVSRFSNWNFRHAHLIIEDAVVHYKACDYQVLGATTATSNLRVLPTAGLDGAQSSVPNSSPGFLPSNAETTSAMIFPTFQPEKENDYVFVSCTESMADYSDSEYSVLSIDDSD